MKPLAIVGIDPGTTAAYAIVDFEGKVLMYYSSKELGLQGVLAAVVERCVPLIVATDKAKVPGFVAEFARKVGAKVVHPDGDLKREDKRVVVQEYSERHAEEIDGDSHECDSIAAALIAFNKYKEWFMKARAFIEVNGLQLREAEFFSLALKSELRFGLVKDLLLKPSVERTMMAQAISGNRITPKEFTRLYERMLGIVEEKERVERVLRGTRQELGRLSKENVFLARKPLKFQEKLDQMLVFKEQRLRVQQQEIEKLMQMNRELRGKITELYQFIADASKYVVVKKMNSLGQKEFAERMGCFGFTERDVVFVNSVSVHSEQVLRWLAQKNISIVTLGVIPENVKRMLSALRVEKEDIVSSNEYFCLVRKEGLVGKGMDVGRVEELVAEYQQERRLGWEMIGRS